MERDILLEVLNSQTIKNDSSASGNLNSPDDSDNIVTVPDETNENNQVDENKDEGHTGEVCIRLNVKSKINM